MFLGRLDRVINLTAVLLANFSFFIDWVAPYSLAITPTNAESDATITYCVEVRNGATQEILDALCGLSETRYTYSREEATDPSPCDIVDVQAIPVNSVGNGTKSRLLETFYESNNTSCCS